MATASKEVKSTNTLPILIGLAVLVVIGFAAWIIQLSRGFSMLGLGQAVVWGVYIATFFTLAGLASSLVILAVLADFEVIPDLKNHRRSLLIGALACYIASGLMIVMDIGKPARILNMIFSTNITSPFVWDFLSLAIAVVLTAIYLFVGAKPKWLSVLTAIFAGLVVIMEGWILSMSAGSILWHGGTMPAVFLVESFLVGMAIVMIADKGEATSKWLKRAMLVLLPVLFLLNLFEIASVLYAGHPEAQLATTLMLNSPLFWVQLVLGVVVPFLLLAFAGKNRTISIVAAVLVVLGVFVAKFMLLYAGQAWPFMLPAVDYNPSLVEIGGVVGILGLAGLLFMLGQQYIHPKDAKA
jgi:molybdopterin-containing oxidoreductase family membrane subunit